MKIADHLCVTGQRVLLALGLLLLAVPRHALAQSPPLPVGRDNDSRIFISHSGCRGTCKIYDLTLLPSGLVVYKGLGHVKTLGRAQTYIEQSRYDELLADFDRINFFSLRECGMTMDAPMTFATVTTRGRTVNVYVGFCDSSVPLTELVKKIEIAVHSKQWTE